MMLYTTVSWLGKPAIPYTERRHVARTAATMRVLMESTKMCTFISGWSYWGNKIFYCCCVLLEVAVALLLWLLRKPHLSATFPGAVLRIRPKMFNMYFKVQQEGHLLWPYQCDIKSARKTTCQNQLQAGRDLEYVTVFNVTTSFIVAASLFLCTPTEPSRSFTTLLSKTVTGTEEHCCAGECL